MQALRRFGAGALSLALILAAFPAESSAQVLRAVSPAAVPVSAPFGAASVQLPGLQAGLPSLGALDGAAGSLQRLQALEIPAAGEAAARVEGGAVRSSFAQTVSAVSESVFVKSPAESAKLGSEASSGLSYELFSRLTGGSYRAASAEVAAPSASESLGLHAVETPEPPAKVVVAPSETAPEGPTGPQGPEGPKKGLWARIKAAFSAVVNVLPNKEDNRNYWIYVIGQIPSVVASQFHVVALPGLVAQKQEDSKRLGTMRTAHYASQAISSLITGPWVDRLPNKTVVVSAGVGLALTLASIPLLFKTGVPMFAPLLGIMVIRAFFQIFGSNAEEVIYTKIVKPHESRLNRANATKTLALGGVAMVASLGAGKFVDWLNASSALAGNAWAYGVGAAMVGLGSLFYAFFLKNRSFSVRDVGPHIVRPTAVQRAGHYFDGFKLILQNRFMRLSMLLMLVQIVALDSMQMMVLPQHVKAISGGSGGFGTLMAASALGSTLAAVAMIFWGSREVKGDAGKKLESDGKKAYLLSALASILFWGVYFAHSVPVAAAFFGLSSFFEGPAGVVYSGLIQKTVPEKSMGKVFSALSVLYPIGTAAGSLVFGSMVAGMSVVNAMYLYAGLMTLDAVLHAIGAFTLFPLDRGDKK